MRCGRCAVRPERAARANRFLSLSYGQKRLALLARALVRRPDWLLLDELYNGLDAAYRRRVDACSAHGAPPRRSRGSPPRTVPSTCRAAHSPGRAPRRATCGAWGRSVPRWARLGARRRRKRRRAGIRRRAARDAAARGAGSRADHNRGPISTSITGPCCATSTGSCARGEHWAVTGANGAGKSSFLKLLYGDLAPAEGGSLERRGFPRGSPIEAWKRRSGCVSPELQADYAIDVSIVIWSRAGGTRASD